MITVGQACGQSGGRESGPRDRAGDQMISPEIRRKKGEGEEGREAGHGHGGEGDGEGE